MTRFGCRFVCMALSIATIGGASCSSGTTEGYDPTVAIVYGTVSIETSWPDADRVVVGYSIGCTDTLGGFSNGGLLRPDGTYRVAVVRLTGEGPACVTARFEVAYGDTLRAIDSVYFRRLEPYDSVRIDFGASHAAITAPR